MIGVTCTELKDFIYMFISFKNINNDGEQTSRLDFASNKVIRM